MKKLLVHASHAKVAKPGTKLHNSIIIHVTSDNEKSFLCPRSITRVSDHLLKLLQYLFWKLPVVRSQSFVHDVHIYQRVSMDFSQILLSRLDFKATNS